MTIAIIIAIVLAVGSLAWVWRIVVQDEQDEIDEALR